MTATTKTTSKKTTITTTTTSDSQSSLVFVLKASGKIHVGAYIHIGNANGQIGSGGQDAGGTNGVLVIGAVLGGTRDVSRKIIVIKW